jgi:pimeloyl-ACP methyl ester carboxylesterase
MGVLRNLARGAALVGAVATGGALAVTAKSILATPQPLESALEGEGRIFRFRSGDVFYKVRGPQGAQPVLLLHGIHLGASSFEWRKNFSELSQGFRVFAPDLPGFGLSDRPAIEYTGELYTQFVTDFAREVVRQPAMVVARGHSAAFAVGAASLDEQLFHRLVLISPSGIVHSPVADGRGGDGLDGQGRLLEALQVPLRQLGESFVGQVPYALLTNKPALAYLLLRQSYANRQQIDPAALQHLYATTHQYGARFAPLAFMSGKLDMDVENAFSMLSQPVLLVWGQEDALNSPLNASDLHMLNPRARLEVLAHAGNAVQEEREHDINELLRAWFLAPSDLVDPSRLERASVAPVNAPASEPLPEEPPEPPAAAALEAQEVPGEANPAAALAAPAPEAHPASSEQTPTPETSPASRPSPRRATPPGAAKGQRRPSAKTTTPQAARSGETEQHDTPRQEPSGPDQPPPRSSSPKRKR